MDEREWHISVERLARSHVALHEVDRATRDLRVDETPLLEVIDDQLTALLALAALHGGHERDGGCLGARLRREHGLVAGALDAVPLIEPLVAGQATLRAAEMPLTKMGGSVARRRKYFGDGQLPLSKTIRSTWQGDGIRSRTDRKPSCHDGRAARGALRFNIEVGEARAFGRELVDARCWRAAQDSSPVHTELAITQIVHQDENDVWFGSSLSVSMR